MSNMTFHWAEELHQRGYSVIPLNGKVPAVEWKEYQSRRSTLGEIEFWFGESSGHDYNLGIVTSGVSGIAVVDCDSPEDSRWWSENFPTTPMVALSGGGGVHMYYRVDAERPARTRARVLGRKIDIRGDGGLVVAPPSVHPASGREYRWQPWAQYSWDAIPVFDPLWVRPTRRALDASLRRFKSQSRVHDPQAYIARIYAVSGQGGHNNTFRAAATLRDAGMDVEEVFQALLEWNTTNALPPWSERELTHKVESVFRAAVS